MFYAILISTLVFFISTSNDLFAQSESGDYQRIESLLQNDAVTRINDAESIYLFGEVVDAESNAFLSGALIELENVYSGFKQTYFTKVDGNFYFKLLPDTEYRLKKMDQGYPAITKSILTHGKEGPEIIHETIKIDQKQQVNRQSNGGVNSANEGIVIRDTFRTYTQSFGTENREEPSIVDPVKPYKSVRYKIQIGSFSEPIQANSKFLRKVKSEYVTERASDGLIRYMVGNFSSLQTARSFHRYLGTQGYRDAYIVAYEDGKRLEMPIEDALEYLNH